MQRGKAHPNQEKVPGSGQDCQSPTTHYVLTSSPALFSFPCLLVLGLPLGLYPLEHPSLLFSRGNLTHVRSVSLVPNTGLGIAYEEVTTMCCFPEKMRASGSNPCRHCDSLPHMWPVSRRYRGGAKREWSALPGACQWRFQDRAWEET